MKHMRFLLLLLSILPLFVIGQTKIGPSQIQDEALSVENFAPNVNPFGISRGDLGSPYELTFDAVVSLRTLNVDADIELSLAATGKISNSFESIISTGDALHVLTFPEAWIMRGDPFSAAKVQEISLKYTGTYVIGYITTLTDIPDIIAPTLTAQIATGNNTTQTLDLTLDEPVNITTAGWTVSASGGAVTVSSVASGNGTSAPKFTLSRLLGGSETITVSYDPGTGNTLDLSGNELVTVSNASVTNNVLSILLYVPFTGTTVDASKGAVTNPDVANLSVTQNGKLIWNRVTDNAVASSTTNYWLSSTTYTRGAFTVLANRDVGFTNSITAFQYYVDANNDISWIGHSTTAGLWSVRVRVGGVVVYTFNTSVSTSSEVKIWYTSANDIHFYYYAAGAWIEVDQSVSKNYNVGANGSIKLATASSASDAPSDKFSYDELYVTDKNFLTATP